MPHFVSFCLAVALACMSLVAHAQSAYPTKPVRVVIPWPPGGSNDIVGRIAAQKLADASRQPFVVENRGGGSGTVGSDVVGTDHPD